MTFNSGEGRQYGGHGTTVLNDLEKCNNKIIHIRDNSLFNSHEFSNAAAKKNLAQESYEIAKYTKELIDMLDM
ncbi:hypothetical protein G6F56_011037 [Rhizopus delemar]|nr:hypothetical protein G6F56_011037 [Rhizopus delemar]